MSFKIKCIGTVKLEQYEIKDIEGGFGENKKCLLVKDIAMLHKQPLGEINRKINDNIKRFEKGIDILDLKGGMEISHSELGYTQNSWNASKNVYILSEKGYSKLLKILDDEKSWERYTYMVDNYFSMRKIIKENNFKLPTTYLEALKQLVASEEARLELENKVNELNLSLDNIKNVLQDVNLKNEDLQNIINISSSQLKIKDKRQLTVDIVRKDCSPKMMAQRFRLLIDNYNSTLRTNVYIRFENYNAKNKPKMTSYIEFIDKVDNKIDILLQIAIKLYKSNFIKIIDDYKTIILGGNV